MRILLISTSSGSRGGGELWLLHLGEGLKLLGHQVMLWASSHESMDELCYKFQCIGDVLRSDYTNIYQRPLRVFSLESPYSSSEQISKQWLACHPDILHLNKQNLEDGLDLLRLVESTLIPSICTIHITQSAQYLGARFAFLRDWVTKQKLSSSKIIFVANSTQRLQSLLPFLKSSRHGKVIHNAVQAYNVLDLKQWRSEYRQKLGINPNQTLFISVGRLVKQKRPFQFLETADIILKKLPNSHFLWVGDGNLLPDWRKEVIHRELSSSVHHLSWQDNVGKWLASSDIYLHTALYEGMPLSVLEALSAGLPCLISKQLLSEIPEFQTEAILALEDNLENIISIVEPQNLEYLRSLSIDLFEKRFTLSRMATEYESLYKSLT